MKLTPEQQAILSSSGDIVINAVAGSGKTTTLIEYARSRTAARRILYLAFNRSVKLEAQRKFEAAGLSNVDVQTAHSLAFRSIIPKHNYQVTGEHKPHEIKDILDLQHGFGDPLAPYLVATHIGHYVALFCNNATKRVDELDYGAGLLDDAAREFVQDHASEILMGARRLLAKMDRGEIPVTHDFYLKKFQLSAPRLTYDCILFDEGQDASPVMLDVFLAQQTQRVIVGDAHQQIYSWRHAVNALAKTSFAQYSLTTSFRFGDNIAKIAMECLGWKVLLGEYVPVVIRGAGASKTTKSSATIARKNISLLRAAIENVSKRGGIKSLYFEGNLSSYTYGGEGASIYDVFNLYVGQPSRVRDPLIKTMTSFGALREYASRAEDTDLSMIIDIVNEYQRDLPSLLKEVKARHVDDDKRSKAEMIFSTVHRCKGLEYDLVYLEDDFITEARLKRLLDKKDEPVDPARLAEEINLAYVAATRARNRLYAPEGMFVSGGVKTITPRTPQKKEPRSFSLEKVRHANPNAYQPWSRELDRELRSKVIGGMSLKELSIHFGRKKGAITTRIKKLEIFAD